MLVYTNVLIGDQYANTYNYQYGICVSAIRHFNPNGVNNQPTCLEYYMR